MIIAGIVITLIVLVLIVYIFGEGFRFTVGFLASLFLSPIIGLISIAMVFKKSDEETKTGFTTGFLTSLFLTPLIGLIAISIMLGIYGQFSFAASFLLSLFLVPLLGFIIVVIFNSMKRKKSRKLKKKYKYYPDKE